MIGCCEISSREIQIKKALSRLLPVLRRAMSLKIQLIYELGVKQHPIIFDDDTKEQVFLSNFSAWCHEKESVVYCGTVALCMTPEKTCLALAFSRTVLGRREMLSRAAYAARDSPWSIPIHVLYNELRRILTTQAYHLTFGIGIGICHKTRT